MSLRQFDVLYRIFRKLIKLFCPFVCLLLYILVFNCSKNIFWQKFLEFTKIISIYHIQLSEPKLPLKVAVISMTSQFSFQLLQQWKSHIRLATADVTNTSHYTHDCFYASLDFIHSSYNSCVISLCLINNSYQYTLILIVTTFSDMSCEIHDAVKKSTVNEN